jgi:hypothetical protein
MCRQDVATVLVHHSMLNGILMYYYLYSSIGVRNGRAYRCVLNLRVALV